MGRYILADVKKNTYICCKHNHYLETYNIDEASEFNSILAANNVLHNNMRNINGSYKPVEKLTILNNLSSLKIQGNNTFEKRLNIPHKEYYTHDTKNHSYMLTNDLPNNLAYFIDLVKDMSDCLSSITNSIEKYDTIVKEKDNATMDIIHFIEFVDLNASEGFKAYKKLQNVRRERRNSKDIIALINLLNDFGITSEKMNKLFTTLNDYFYERTYSPRKVDLFNEFCKGEPIDESSNS